MTRLNILPAEDPAVTQFPGPSFRHVLDEHGVKVPRRDAVETLQINVGKRCNQACHHCHVEAGPNRTEVMQRDVADRLIALVADCPSVQVVDITGGAPELNPHFRDLVVSMRGLGRRVIDRCNLTVLLEPGMEDLAEFLAEQRVEITASLPCYGRDNVDQQRGRGVFDKSIEALERLNRLGYGLPDTGLTLDLVYNPGGAFLPPDQGSLQAQYKEELRTSCGIEFNQLFTITNMPIKRFAHTLHRDGNLEAYMSLLVNHFNPTTVDSLMCRTMVSVGHDGKLYDCDFNQMLEIPIDARDGAVESTVWGVESLDSLSGRPIATDSHCLGCTAGAGSSCGGALQ